jgi:hypothetical protein
MKCKYCDNEVLNSIHMRWCSENPNIDLNKKLHSESIRIGASERVRKAHAEGKYENAKYNTKGRIQTQETKDKLRAIALTSKHRRLVRSTRAYKCKDGTEVLLDSSWEETLAKRLDELNIAWIRPEVPIPWTDHNGISHNYFPDFLLTKHNLYLDPKNPIAYNVQRAKIDIITKQLSNLIILKTLKECQEFNV